MTWQLKEAKQKFSELVRRATEEGPQIVARDDEEIAVVLSIQQYRLIMERKPTFKEFLFSGPKLDNDVVEEIFARSKEPARIFEFDQ